MERLEKFKAQYLSESVNYLCRICTQNFTQESDFLDHHITSNGDLFKCCKCDAQYPTLTDLYDHLEQHASETVILDDGDEFVVEDTQNSDANELVYILEEGDEEESSENVQIVQMEHGYVMPKEKPKPVKTVRRQAIKKPFVVPNFSSTKFLTLEPTDDISVPHFKCVRCEQLFISKFAFFKHIEKGKCYVNICDVCSSRFERNSDFYEHYCMMHRDRAICNFCFRTFLYEKNVREHMMRHLDQFKHLCGDCNKGFYTVREFRNHYKNKHMGIKYSCEFCGHNFSDIYYFKKHMATHKEASTEIE